MEGIDNYLYELVKYSGDVIFTVGPTQCILSWNVGSEELLGYKPHEVIVDLLSPPGNKRQMRSMVVEVMESGTLKNLECELVAREGKVVTVYLTASPIHDTDGDVVAVSVIAKDVTDQNRLLLALIEKEKRSAHLEALLQSLATISHHIRNAAMVISAKSEVALQLGNAHAYQEMAKVSLQQTRRINAVIESLNDMVREVRTTGDDLKTVEMTCSPAPHLDIEERLKERLRRLDEEERA